MNQPEEESRTRYITTFRDEERPALAANVYLERGYNGGPDSLFYEVSRAWAKKKRSDSDKPQFGYSQKMYSGCARPIKNVVEQAEAFIRKHLVDPEAAVAAGEQLNEERKGSRSSEQALAA